MLLISLCVFLIIWADTWQSPIGTQQMTTILHDMYRAGLRGVDKTPQTSRIMSYIMAHAPGTTAKMWRRAMYGCECDTDTIRVAANRPPSPHLGRALSDSACFDVRVVATTQTSPMV